LAFGPSKAVKLNTIHILKFYFLDPVFFSYSNTTTKRRIFTSAESYTGSVIVVIIQAFTVASNAVKRKKQPSNTENVF
jgi:hypothetical protein